MSLTTWLRQWAQRAGPDAATPIRLTLRRIYIMPSSTGVLYAMVLFIMLLGAINYGLSLGYALVFLLAGLGFSGMVHTFRNLVHLGIVPGRAEPVFAGETATFHVVISNPHRNIRRAVELAFAGNAATTLDIPAQGEALAEVRCQTLRRGRLVPGRITLSTRYPLGLFRAWSYPYPPLSGLVYPAPLDTPLPPHAPAAYGSQRDGNAGQEDFSGLRLRQPNDSPQHIAWKAVARNIDSQQLLVKQFSGGGASEQILDWALTPEALDDETRLSILTGWILAAEREGLHYGLRLPGIDIAPNNGAAHRAACLEALALYQGQAS